MNVNKEMFREYDIRGVYGTDLNAEVAYLIGKAFGTKLRELNINTIEELAKANPEILNKYFKNRTIQIIENANGIDNSKVEYEYSDPKSISTSTSLAYNYKVKEEIYKEIKELTKDTGNRLRKNKLYAQNVSIWIKYTDFTKVSKQIKLNNPISSDIDIYNNAIKLFNKIWNEEGVRALCVGVSDLTKNNNIQLNLFSKPLPKTETKQDKKLKETIDKLNKKLERKAKEPVGFWETIFGAFADMFR